MTVLCILSHRKLQGDGTWKEYIAGQTYTMESLETTFFEEYNGQPTNTAPVSSYVTTTSGNMYYAEVDASAASKTVVLPPVASCVGRVYVVKKSDNSANTVTLDGDGSELIDSAGTLVIATQNDAYSIMSDGIKWKII